MTLEEIQAERARLQAELERQNSAAMREAAFANGGSLSLDDIRRERAALEAELQRQQRLPQAHQNAAQAAAARQIARGAAPMGIGNLTQPLVNMVMDPARRQEVGRSFQGFVRDVQQLPSLNWRQVGQDALQQASEGIQNLPQTAGQIIQNLPRIVDEATVAPFRREEEAQRRLDLARGVGDDPSQAAQQANAATGQAAINVAAPLAMGGSASALRAGLVGAGATAPMAFGGEGSLQERIPRGIVQTGAGAALGAGVQGVANALPRVLNAPQRAQRIGQSFERAGVDPSYAALNAGTFGGRMTGALTNTIADNPIAGVTVRQRMGRQMEQAAAEARRIQGGYGGAASPEGAGATVQRGLRRYASDRTAPNPRPGADPRSIDTSEWSVPAQADAIYDHVLRPVESNQTNLQNTVRAISEVEALADNNPVVRELWNDPSLRSITTAAHELYTSPTQTLSLKAAREMRRRLRVRMGSPEPGQDYASLQRVYSALTEDIYAAAGPAAANLRRADQFYQRSMNRINETLAGVLNVSDPSAINPSEAFNAIRRAADGRRGNLRMLVAVKRALRPAELRTLAASLIDDMGRPTNGAGGTQAAELGFSVNTFSTNWNAMSPQARRILFGSARSNQLARALDDLAVVADSLKGVERTTNASGSGRYANIAATVGGAATNMPATIAVLTSGLITGELLTNPTFVRWLTSAARAGQRPGGMRGAMRDLSRLAASDPAIAAYAAELSQRAPDASGDPAGTPPQRAPALQ